MAWVAPVVAAGASLLGGIAGNRQSAKEARLNRQFQERMSSTAHQREIKDLIAAGLNPILSAGGKGASSPSGSSATQQNPAAGLAASAASLAQAQATTKVAAATARKTGYEADLLEPAADAAQRIGKPIVDSSVNSAQDFGNRFMKEIELGPPRSPKNRVKINPNISKTRQKLADLDLKPANSAVEQHKMANALKHTEVWIDNYIAKHKRNPSQEEMQRVFDSYNETE